MRAGSVLRLCALRYRQGQQPEPGIREYFYYVDHQGQLFLDDARVKNFVSCYKDVAFLSFFFTRLRPNHDSRYRSRFPFVARCGRERNFLRCADTPVVFTRLLPGHGGGDGDAAEPLLSFCGGGAALAVPFRPEALAVLPENGRLYHPAPEGAGGVGLVRWELAAEWSAGFEFGRGEEEAPTHFWWGGRRYRLKGEVGEVRRRMGGVGGVES